MKNVYASLLFLLVFILNANGQAFLEEMAIKATEGIVEKCGTEGFIEMATKNIGEKFPAVASGSGIYFDPNSIGISNYETSQKGNVLRERLHNSMKTNLDIVESFTQKVCSIKGFTNDDVKEFQEDGIHKSQIYERSGNEGPTGLPDLSIQKSFWSLETVTAPSLNAEELGKR